MALIIRQIWALVHKTVLLTAVRHPIWTTIRALVVPLIFVLILAYAQYFLNPPQHFGVGSAAPILSLERAIAKSSPARDRVAFVIGDYPGPSITNVFNQISHTFRDGKKTVVQTDSEDALPNLCQSSSRGSSNCFAAVVFNSSPDWPTAKGVWNYTIRADPSLGGSFDVTSDSNDAQIYLLPLQQTIDEAIIAQNPNYRGKDLGSVKQYPFTAINETQREMDTHQSYCRSGISLFGILFFFGMVGVVYHATGVMAYEREMGLTKLIEAMMPNKSRFLPQMIRLFAHHIAFSLVYLPGWLAMGIVMAVKVFTHTNPAIVICYHILCGLALTSYALLGASLFKKAQISGIAVSVVAIVMAIIPQVLPDEKSTIVTVVAMSAVFPSANYVYFILYLFRWEFQFQGAILSVSAPDTPWRVSGGVLFILLVVQICLYPVGAFIIERILFGTTSKHRQTRSGEVGPGITINVKSFSKTYKSSFLSKIFFRSRPTVQAVKSLDLQARKGQICMLLGPNGSGKSTTLDAIAGLSKPSDGLISVDGSGGLGIAPQKNVLWNDLTVAEHVKIFSSLKSGTGSGDYMALIEACDISLKTHAYAKSLSGGQKRKLQLALMFAGGSAVCCVDEVSSGLDPLSRRKVWDILLAQRATRTIIMTTHFLDEADFLSDHIVILSKGSLKAEGSSAELKERYGKGYTIKATGPNNTRTFAADNAAHAAELMNSLEHNNIYDYGISGPTLEDVFLRLAGTSLIGADTVPQADGASGLPSGVSEKTLDVSTDAVYNEKFSLENGRHLNGFKQFAVLFLKRAMVFRRKWGPYLGATIVALIGAGVSILFLKNYQGVQCATAKLGTTSLPGAGYIENIGTSFRSELVEGPVSKSNEAAVAKFAKLYFAAFEDATSSTDMLGSNLYNTSSLQEFSSYLSEHTSSLEPGGFWLGDANSDPVIAWTAKLFGFADSLKLLNVVNNVLSNTTIITNFAALNSPDVPQAFDFIGLLFVTYFSLVFCAYPALYALYPTVERTRQVRALEYSNGVRPIPLWLASLAFDSIHVIGISVIATILLAVGCKIFYHIGIVFVVLVLYGIASTLLAYIISMFAKTQLAAWVMATGGQALFCLGYIAAYPGIFESTNVADLESNLDKVQYSMGLVSPICNLVRALWISLNEFLVTCGRQNQPGSIELYGGPILYLIVQCFVFFVILIIWDSGFSATTLLRGHRAQRDDENLTSLTPDVSKELARTRQASSGLRVTHLTKSFGKNTAVDDVSFGIEKSNIFTLLGPNGAGKSTTISLIRGDIIPSTSNSSIQVDEISMSSHPAKVRSRLGVCPQFDANDVLTVEEHLKFYARIRGVQRPAHNVEELIRACGLQNYRHQLASKLSGGTKRKLSLAIAMAGNPSVLLLDEPSSGLDAVSKRAMWNTLRSIQAARSILLTTHSMEEADALADRAGIMSNRILAIGTPDELRQQWGDVYHVHIVTRSAPHTSLQEMESLKAWIRANVSAAKMDDKTYGGQLRFAIPAAHNGMPGMSSVGRLFNLLERNRDHLNIGYYAIGETTLDQIFVNVVREHGGSEEGHAFEHKSPWWKSLSRHH